MGRVAMDERPIPDQYGYLRGLSSGAQGLIISFVNQGEPNLYHSAMAVIQNFRPKSLEEIQTRYYSGRHIQAKPYIVERKHLVDEIIAFCFERYRKKHNNADS